MIVIVGRSPDTRKFMCKDSALFRISKYMPNFDSKPAHFRIGSQPAFPAIRNRSGKTSARRLPTAAADDHLPQDSIELRGPQQLLQREMHPIAPAVPRHSRNVDPLRRRIGTA